jgi:uncharacterized protein
MSIALYDVTVPNFLQVLGSLRGVLDKGLDYAKTKSLSADSLAEARLIEDMFPLSLQVQRVADHSSGALRDVQQGKFSMPSMTPVDYAGMQRLLAEAEASVKGWTRASVNALEGREVIFDLGSRRSSFVAEAFLLSFSLPNFYFHATTAYDVLRAKGVPIGKRDFLGQLRLKLE